ncbi:YqeB family protein [Micromonospora cathayae]|uniref:Uncharacterized protein n=1 Tax=Micromonospora cathayae TaxID=3028804 RepID=A0ABY7ZVR6_9ACTN|nr:hypothetical protein [Micromonospora sp. HUAS 3]WDZ87085.1 hypothetical protein PVK37_12095 [Micromonospora sp. HUAS 3]
MTGRDPVRPGGFRRSDRSGWRGWLGGSSRPERSGWPGGSNRSGGPGVPTVVGGGGGELAVFWAGFPLLGAGAGWLLTAFAPWLVDVPWRPLRRLARWYTELPEPPATVGALTLGVLAGLALAGVASWERLVVRVGADRVALRRNGRTRELPRATVRAVHLDGRQLVLLGPDDEELVREKSDLSGRRLRTAFRTHGYPWVAEDPHRTDWRRWVPGLPGLPAGADALLRARQDALKRRRRDDALDLRRELAGIGLVVRDEADRQYVRRTGTAPD